MIKNISKNRMEKKMRQTTRLKALIQSKKILVAPGAFDALSARLIEAVGFKTVYMSGFGTAASIFGIPDIGLLTMTEMVGNAKRISEAVRAYGGSETDFRRGYGGEDTGCCCCTKG